MVSDASGSGRQGSLWQQRGKAVSAKAEHPPESGIDSSIAGISRRNRGCALLAFRE